MMIKDLYRLNMKDVLRAVTVFTRAFHNDPLVCIMYPNDEERKKLSTYLWKLIIRDGIRYGEVLHPLASWKELLNGYHLKKNTLEFGVLLEVVLSL